MLPYLKNLNTNLNLFKALFLKLKKFIAFLKRQKLWTTFIIIVVILVGFLLYRKYSPKSPEQLYELETVQKQDLSQFVSASGSIASETEVNLKFQTSGQLAWVGVKEGDLVKKWQAIASLDTRALRKSLEQELIDYSKERNDFEEDRLETYGEGTDLTGTIKRILQKNQWDLNRATLDVELQNITMQYATIISPIDGIVTHIDVPVPGVNITATTALFTVADPQNLEFVAKVDEVDIGLLEATQSAQIILDAYPDDPIDTFISTIDFASSTDSSGSTVYLARFKLNNPDLNRYRLGMNGEVIITTSQKSDILAVPYQSILEDGQTEVQVVEDDQVKKVPVITGIVGDEYIEVTSGLKEGQTIVVSKKQK
jgi:membrane fusion protein, macrolide-specific efflux system